MRHARFLRQLGEKRTEINVVRQILIPPFGGSSPPAPASNRINQQLLSSVLILCDVAILNVILRLILNVRSRRVR
jgi:hypothetical protein